MYVTYSLCLGAAGAGGGGRHEVRVNTISPTDFRDALFFFCSFLLVLFFGTTFFRYCVFVSLSLYIRDIWTLIISRVPHRLNRVRFCIFYSFYLDMGDIDFWCGFFLYSVLFLYALELYFIEEIGIIIFFYRFHNFIFYILEYHISDFRRYRWFFIKKKQYNKENRIKLISF